MNQSPDLMANSNTARLYFGYGSNLWRHQMAQRCPNSTYEGVARLPGYKWIIYDRGYANVVKKDQPGAASSGSSPLGVASSDEAYGLVYILSPSDEARLDKNEGVPYAYQKEIMDVEFWRSEGDSWVDVGDRGKMQTRSMLVYIDHKGTVEHTPKEEYIYRMNKGIEDALRLGVPQDYVDQVMRPFIPQRSKPEVVQKAQKQAIYFQDENGQL